MKPMKYTILLAAFTALTLHSHAVNILGINPNILLNDGASIDGTADDQQSTFSQEFLIISNGLALSDPVQISDIPIETRNGFANVRVIFDSQETGQAGAHHIALNSITVYGQTSSVATLGSLAASTPIWSSSEVINVNPIDGGTDSPQGNGADLALYLPLPLLAGLNSDDYLFFVVDQSDGGNGSDEWAITNGVTLPPGCLIGPNGCIPEPSSVGLIALSGVALALRRRR